MSLEHACAAAVCLRHHFMTTGRDGVFRIVTKKESVWSYLHSVPLSCFCRTSDQVPLKVIKLHFQWDEAKLKLKQLNGNGIKIRYSHEETNG